MQAACPSRISALRTRPEDRQRRPARGQRALVCGGVDAERHSADHEHPGAASATGRARAPPPGRRPCTCGSRRSSPPSPPRARSSRARSAATPKIARGAAGPSAVHRRRHPAGVTARRSSPRARPAGARIIAAAPRPATAAKACRRQLGRRHRRGDDRRPPSARRSRAAHLARPATDRSMFPARSASSRPAAAHCGQAADARPVDARLTPPLIVHLRRRSEMRLVDVIRSRRPSSPRGRRRARATLSTRSSLARSTLRPSWPAINVRRAPGRRPARSTRSAIAHRGVGPVPPAARSRTALRGRRAPGMRPTPTPPPGRRPAPLLDGCSTARAMST